MVQRIKGPQDEPKGITDIVQGTNLDRINLLKNIRDRIEILDDLENTYPGLTSVLWSLFMAHGHTSANNIKEWLTLARNNPGIDADHRRWNPLGLDEFYARISRRSQEHSIPVNVIFDAIEKVISDPNYELRSVLMKLGKTADQLKR